EAEAQRQQQEAEEQRRQQQARKRAERKKAREEGAQHDNGFEFVNPATPQETGVREQEQSGSSNAFALTNRPESLLENIGSN
ncbi:MAG: hypothetical protein JO185_07780, partial [Acidobacteriaceae bacterium]|nr:hypothetical protein [Acidobacteriaceae bacterium]